MAIWEVGSGKTYSTIAGALAALYTAVGSDAFTETQTIKVYDGTYAEGIAPNANLNPTATYRLVITSVNGYALTTATSVSITGVDYVTVNGFTLNSGSGANVFLNYGCSYFIMSNSYLYAIGSTLGSGIYGSTNVTYFNNFIYFTNGRAFIIDDGSHNFTMYNNAIYTVPWIAIFVRDSNTFTAYNNTIVSNYGQAAISFYSGNCINSTIKNNIIYAANGACYEVNAGSQSGLVLDYNDVYSTINTIGLWDATYYGTLAQWRTGTSQDANSISADPQLVDYTGTTVEKYKFAFSSPCKDKGTSIVSVTTDYFGTKRPQNLVYDIGFYELIKSKGGQSGSNRRRNNARIRSRVY